jgi:putative ABC transport system permease protein
VLSLALRNVVARRRRAALTALAVLLGVSMISGTLVFTDTINSAFRQLFSDSAKGSDAIVSSRQDSSSFSNATASIPAVLVTKIRTLPGVRDAQGQVSDFASIVGRNGKVIKNAGGPALALSYLPPPFGGLTFVKGSAPRGPGQVALDQATAGAQHYRVGDLVPIVTAQPVRRFEVSGIVRLGGASLGGATFVVFSLPAAQQLYGKSNRLDLVYVAGAARTAPASLVREIRPLLSPELIVRSAHGQVDADVQRVGNQLGILTGGLLAFGFIAVFVGAFVIFNTFSITVAQRVQEFALLRAIGASGRQVLQSVLVEAAAIGLLASLAGLLGGLAAAAAIRALFDALGFNLPSTGLVFGARTAIVGLAVGVLVTVAAGLVPALRATRVAPLEALRRSAVVASPSGWHDRVVPILAAVLGIGGLSLIFGSSGTTSSRLAASAAGSVALLVAVVVLSPRVVRRLAGIVAWPLVRRGGIIPRLAEENAARNPGRTAVSASSLMVGLALVLFVTVYASGLRASSTQIIDRTFIGDFTIENQDGFSPIPAAAARAVAVVPDVLSVSSLKTASASLGSAKHVTAAGVDPTTIAQVYRFDWVNGSQATLDDLTIGDVIVERDTARRSHVTVGDRVAVTTETGRRDTFTVRGIYRDQALLRGFVLPRSSFDQIFHQPRLQEVFVKLTPDADRATATAALTQALSVFPDVQPRSEKQLRDEVAGRVNSILVLFYALLAMSVLMSLLGIVNTLTLSIHERTRELGTLRAIGMTPDQARTLVRDESVITAAMGTSVGVVLGIFFAWIMTRALTSDGVVFSVPWLQVFVLVAVGLLAGVVAALPPARRAGRLDVLAAIANE